MLSSEVHGNAGEDLAGKVHQIMVAISPSSSSYGLGSHVVCLSTWDNAQHHAEIVDHRQGKKGAEYYVHYLDQNRRLDEWISTSRIEHFEIDSDSHAKSVGAEKLLPAISPSSASLSGPGISELKLDTPGTLDRKLTRNLKRRYDEMHNVQKGVEELAPIEQTLEKEHEEKTKVKNIQVVELGNYEIDTWYYSPYPEDYAHAQKLFICEFCLKYMRKRKSLDSHKMKCKLKHPPGDEIYHTAVPDSGVTIKPSELEDSPSTTQLKQRESSKLQYLAVFEVHGKLNKLYCQNLCLFAKLFLDHKTLYYDVENFLFYVLTELDDTGYHPVGYFSKEICSVEDFNLACILTLPPFQRKGYGRFLIALAYELSKKESKVGTPERPLSDLGQVSFRSYWTHVLLESLREHGGNLSIKDLSLMTAIRSEDIVSTLQPLNLIRYWKGQHIISVSPKMLDEHLKNVTSQPNWVIDPAKLHWTPPAAYAQKKPR
ncbi:hypothetical protein O6H91_01G106100 [Diphasiastrum complanatum]|uniref:Uncharacterized protein n=8 Tax=Diphasiastrum complanatum TaxID=34168 RepID=A0ACC2ES42_DIPCM|nr:hypothetical protein O6H91_01G069100 [Diphasiastrum complanatum]KAJ7569257.1 hypothetical protein O6H91_01G069100 [Diphasiastrum complanatum]KAJ7569258.1 hypothetical protein O6H91_01G069100 [Diphasiastrum complanatum]KAJ7569259.1 hypothetical protein O6H91_01G069100 [Diphasiastrum complanatum]KAJ7570074.1 hypothetical protein O6H91_01G106100 [Diphasiastrum complanatum]